MNVLNAKWQIDMCILCFGCGELRDISIVGETEAVDGKIIKFCVLSQKFLWLERQYTGT
jgi:hypothetical protein